MKPSHLLLLSLALAGGAAWAQKQPAADATPPADPAETAPGEPAVQRTVVEDEGSRISELRVRGQVQRITVQPKVGVARAYEIIPAESGRAPDDGQGAAGKRVWQVLSF